MKRYWVSWHQPSEDYRPVYEGGSSSTVMDVEPNILGWWCSGTAEDDRTSILCGLMIGQTESAIQLMILRYWPDAIAYPMRFVNEVSNDWWPDPGRFPRRAINEKITRESSGAKE